MVQGIGRIDADAGLKRIGHQTKNVLNTPFAIRLARLCLEPRVGPVVAGLGEAIDHYATSELASAPEPDISARIDLALAWVEEDCGSGAAAVARELVLFLRRPGDQPQLSISLAAQAGGNSWAAAAPALDCGESAEEAFGRTARPSDRHERA